ncbi:LBR protein, partial [Polypterus senegalus]|nr:delta(14)-sterol reductase TM7SF2 [Polypterus senegalus]MBN3294140.1 LBR protein [Polypterus senegalus]
MEEVTSRKKVDAKADHLRADSKSSKLENGNVEGKKVHLAWNNTYLLLLFLLLPVIIRLCQDGCLPPDSPWSILSYEALWDWDALYLVLAHTILQAVLYYLPAGKVVEGKIGHTGKRLRYNINAVHAFITTTAILGLLYHNGLVRVSFIFHKTGPIISATIVVSLILSYIWYLKSFWASEKELVDYGEKGNFLQDFFLGREIDPRIGKIDIKQFCMVRIGFIGWGLVNVSFLMTDIERNGTPSLSLLLVVTFQLLYVLDTCIDEESILFTKEYTEDGIGFTMTLGEFLWIPFFSTLQAYYLLHRPFQLCYWAVPPILLLYLAGFAIYYLSGEQKDGYRLNPKDPAYSHLETIETGTGKNLLVSGWFGWLRHPNYLGDIMMHLAWSLPCGFSSWIPYFSFISCLNILRQRAEETEKECAEKYGLAWKEYCRRVKYKLFPYVY